MNGRIILLRDHLKESEKAEKMLKKYNINHAQLFCSKEEGRLPSIISPDSAYAYEGIGGVQLFVTGYIKR